MDIERDIRRRLCARERDGDRASAMVSVDVFASIARDGRARVERERGAGSRSRTSRGRRSAARASAGERPSSSVVDVMDVAKVLSHVAHAKTTEPTYVVLKLGLSLTNVTRAGRAKLEPAKAKNVAWVVERRSEGKATMEEFWSSVNAEAVRALFPSVTAGEDTARLLRALYFKAERADLSPLVGGLAMSLLLERLMTSDRAVAFGTKKIRTVRAMNAPRPLAGELFANPEVIYHEEKGPDAKRQLLPHELDEEIAQKLGTRAAFHSTCVAQLEDDSWIEIDIAGPALDNYTLSDDGAVPMCVDGIAPEKLVGWTSSVAAAEKKASASDVARARLFADTAFGLLVM